MIGVWPYSSLTGGAVSNPQPSIEAQTRRCSLVPTFVLVAWSAFTLFAIISDYTSQDVKDFIRNTGGQYCQYESMARHIGGLLGAFAVQVAVMVVVLLLARAGRCRLSMAVFFGFVALEIAGYFVPDCLI